MSVSKKSQTTNYESNESNNLNNYRATDRSNRGSSTISVKESSLPDTEKETSSLQRDIPEGSENEERNEEVLQNLVLNLKVIAKVKPNDKLNVDISNNKIYIDNNYYTQGFIRYYNSDSRAKTLSFLEELDKNLNKEINSLINNLNKKNNTINKSHLINEQSDLSSQNNYLSDEPSNILINLSHDLKQSVGGINNLILTYIEDEYIKSKLEILVININLKITKISSLLKLS